MFDRIPRSYCVLGRCFVIARKKKKKNWNMNSNIVRGLDEWMANTIWNHTMNGRTREKEGRTKKAERFSAQITMLVRCPRIGTVCEKEPCAGLTVVPPVKSSDISVLFARISTSAHGHPFAFFFPTAHWNVSFGIANRWFDTARNVGQASQLSSFKNNWVNGRCHRSVRVRKRLQTMSLSARALAATSMYPAQTMNQPFPIRRWLTRHASFESSPTNLVINQSFFRNTCGLWH